MRHRKKGKKFHRISSERKSFLRNLATNLVRAEKIGTTEARAKAIRPMVERWLTCAKKQTLASRRILLKCVHNKGAVEKLMNDLASRYGNRSGGYTRVVKLGRSRKRDGAKQARIEFV